MTNVTTHKATAEFSNASDDFDILMVRLACLRERSFDVDGTDQPRNWGEVGSVRFANQKLREVLQHFGLEPA